MIIVMRKSNIILIGLILHCWHIQPEYGCGFATATVANKTADQRTVIVDAGTGRTRENQ